MPFFKDYTKFEAYICSAYDGELPVACRGKHLAITQHTKASGGDKVCLVSRTVEHILSSSFFVPRGAAFLLAYSAVCSAISVVYLQ
jgi:hypothetical protein